MITKQKSWERVHVLILCWKSPEHSQYGNDLGSVVVKLAGIFLIKVMSRMWKVLLRMVKNKTNKKIEMKRNSFAASLKDLFHLYKLHISTEWSWEGPSNLVARMEAGLSPQKAIDRAKTGGYVAEEVTGALLLSAGWDAACLLY